MLGMLQTSLTKTRRELETQLVKRLFAAELSPSLDKHPGPVSMHVTASHRQPADESDHRSSNQSASCKPMVSMSHVQSQSTLLPHQQASLA